MTDFTELKRLAESLPQLPWSYEANGFILAWDGTERSRCENVGGFYYVCEGVSNFREYLLALEPAKVLALIAENERNQRMVLSACMSMGAIGESLGLDMDSDGDEMLGMVAELKAERDQLRAEVAGLRTGYEAYEQVNAELKAENVRIERNRDMWKGQVERQAEELTALRKRIDDMSPFKGAPFTGPDTKCLACGGYHYGMSGLPCPNMRITAQADLPETRSGQIGAALGQGEQS